MHRHRLPAVTILKLPEQQMPEKSDLEKFAVIEFCDAYNRRHPGRHLTYVEGCRPPLPDTRCTLADQEVYIEVAHLYGYPSDAKRLLGRQGHSYPSAAEQQQARLTPLSVRIGDSLARVLQRKCERTYTTSAWLLVRNANPLWTHSDFHSYLADTNITPGERPFEQLWLLCGRGADSGIIDLSIGRTRTTAQGLEKS